MLEYVFFNRLIAERFIAFMKSSGLDYIEEIEAVQNGIVFKVNEDHVTDLLWDALDDYYDELNEEDQKLVQLEMSGENEVSKAGIYLRLADGRQTIAAVNPDVMNRILAVLSMDEFDAFVDVIVKSVEQPDDSAICQKIARS